MAVTFTALYVIGALAVGYRSGERAAWAAAAVGFVMLAGAVALLAYAHRELARLMARRRVLERELGGRGAV